mmetsp:Transcript_36880/g.94302  ORF Transcript_36880/g.94302 Transcript_36880/m.94302 type:complete len:214 (-) Transcript_36880:1653-2294(-)
MATSSSARVSFLFCPLITGGSATTLYATSTPFQRPRYTVPCMPLPSRPRMATFSSLPPTFAAACSPMMSTSMDCRLALLALPRAEGRMRGSAPREVCGLPSPAVATPTRPGGMLNARSASSGSTASTSDLLDSPACNWSLKRPRGRRCTAGTPMSASAGVLITVASCLASPMVAWNTFGSRPRWLTAALPSSSTCPGLAASMMRAPCCTATPW